MVQKTTFTTAFEALPYSLRHAKPAAVARASSPPCYIDGSHTVQLHKGATQNENSHQNHSFKRSHAALSLGAGCEDLDSAVANGFTGTEGDCAGNLCDALRLSAEIEATASFTICRRSAEERGRELGCDDRQKGTSSAGKLFVTRWRQSDALSFCISSLLGGGQLGAEFAIQKKVWVVHLHLCGNAACEPVLTRWTLPGLSIPSNAATFVGPPRSLMISVSVIA